MILTIIQPGRWSCSLGFRGVKEITRSKALPWNAPSSRLRLAAVLDPSIATNENRRQSLQDVGFTGRAWEPNFSQEKVGKIGLFTTSDLENDLTKCGELTLSWIALIFPIVDARQQAIVFN